ncbi:MAG TPA: HAMP domain-containing sensor histidine kinase [Acidimicrobiales bacterium]|nr:HAMP domain-containing sensor histidine kinase [Acidimicrobiales bacterium]
MSDERDILADASHQLKTPLAALRLRLEDMSLWHEAGPSLRDELLECVKEVDRLTGIVEDILALSRAGEDPEITSVDLSDAAASAVARWRKLFADKERTLRFHAPPEPVVITTAPRPLLQVIDVLLENARNHGAGEASVEVLATATHGLLHVGDEGRLEPAVMDRMFERTYRSATSAGSGIGLALARTIVDATGGRLRVSNADPTCFELSFRLA